MLKTNQMVSCNQIEELILRSNSTITQYLSSTDAKNETGTEEAVSKGEPYQLCANLGLRQTLQSVRVG